MPEEKKSIKLEIEIKVRLTDPADFTARVSALGFQLKTPETMETNLLFDTPDGLLQRRKEILRIRQYGNKWKLTHKAPAENAATTHKTRVETETGLEDGEALAGIFERLGYRQIFRYEKLRTEWSDGIGHIVTDVTPIGNFAELEGNRDWIDKTAQKLGISQSEYLTASYGQLFAEWKKSTKNPAANMTFSEINP